MKNSVARVHVTVAKTAIEIQEMSMTDSPKMMQANAKFRKLQRAEGAKKNLSEIEANDALVRANTARLKALRLARDAAEQAFPATPVAPAKKTSAKKSKGKSGNLSDWLDGQQSSGRNN
jgi:hypothetical protein